MHAAVSSLVRPSCGTLSLPLQIKQKQRLVHQGRHNSTVSVSVHNRCNADWCRIQAHSSRDACLVTAPVTVPLENSSHSSDAASTQGPDTHSLRNHGPTGTQNDACQPTVNCRFDSGILGNNILPMASGTAASSVTVHSSEGEVDKHSQPMHVEQEEDVLHEQQQDRQAAAGAANQLSASLWVPDKQLWVPQSSMGIEDAQSQTATVASSIPCEEASISNRPRSLSRVYMAAAATQGRKKFMEDRHVLATLDPAHGVQQAHGPVGLKDKVSVAAVFDGHAGYATAAYAAQHIPQLLHEALSGRPSTAQGGPRVPQRRLLAPKTALAASFHWFDRWWADARCDPAFTEHGWDDSGSTAVVGMVLDQQLVVGNAGDSVALLASGGHCQRLTVEHRLDNAEEVERVLEAGGRVVSFRPGAIPRVMGNSSQTRFKGSMVTRSLGDFAFKHPQAIISADPHVTVQHLTPADRLVVLTSDGVTDVLPDDDMLGTAIRAIEETQQSTNNGQALARAAAHAIMNTAMEIGSTDNITVVVILLDWDCEYSVD